LIGSCRKNKRKDAENAEDSFMSYLRFVSGSIFFLAGMLLLAGCVSSGPSVGRTSLSDSANFEVIKEPSVTIEWGGEGAEKMKAVLAGNEAVGAEHRAGYNGLIELHCGDGPSPFVPAYAGLNLEHVNNGNAYPDRKLQFEPRNHPMEIRKINDRTYELYESALPETGVESCTRFEFKDPHYIDVTFECIPRQEKFPFGYLNLFWASYIEKPEDNGIYFLGGGNGTEARWIRMATEKHGVKSTARDTWDNREFDYQKPFPLTLVFNESDDRHLMPFYYGRYGNYVWELIFASKDMVRFTHSPSGGGQNNPAWDFQWFIEKPVKDKVYRLSYRASYRRWSGQQDMMR